MAKSHRFIYNICTVISRHKLFKRATITTEATSGIQNVYQYVQMYSFTCRQSYNQHHLITCNFH